MAGSSTQGITTARTGFDPRALATPDRSFRISPRRIQAWREVPKAGQIEPGDADGDREGGPA